MTRINILSGEKAGFETPITTSIDIVFSKITSAKLYVTLTPSTNIPIPTPAQELSQFTVNGFPYTPSDKFKSVNTIQPAHFYNGNNTFTFKWVTSFFQRLIPDGKISAWLELTGQVAGGQFGDIFRKLQDWFKENTPAAIAIIILVMVIVIALAYTTSKVAPLAPSYKELKGDVKSVKLPELPKLPKKLKDVKSKIL